MYQVVAKQTMKIIVGFGLFMEYFYRNKKKQKCYTPYRCIKFAMTYIWTAVPCFHVQYQQCVREENVELLLFDSKYNIDCVKSK